MTTIDLAIADAPDVVSQSEYRYVQPADWSGLRYRVDPRPALRLRVEHGDDYTVMVEVETGIHGVGGDVREAWGDLLRALTEHVDLLRRQESLSSGLAYQLDYLSERLGA